MDKCPFGENKGACSKCEIHCYKPDMRDQVRRVMCYAGPRMLTRHPVLAVEHLIKEKFTATERAGRKKDSDQSTEKGKRH